MKALFAALSLSLPAAAERPPRPVLGSGSGSASAPMRGPVAFSLRSYAADVDVVASAQPRLAVSVTDKPGMRVALLSTGGDRIEVEFAGKRQLHDGKLRIEVPRGSSIDVSAVSGRVSVSGLGGRVRIRGMSGEVKVAGATEVDVETVDGAVEVSDAAGQVRIHTISGSSAVVASEPASRLELETSSGQVAFRGPCGKGCHLDIDTVSGEVRFALGPESSFAASVISTSGKVHDDLPVGLRAVGGPSEGAWSEGRYGDGDGVIECETFSGDISFAAR